MAFELDSSPHEPFRPHNPWEKFTIRDEKKHYAEDQSRLCPLPQISALEAIEKFLGHGCTKLDEPILRKRQLVRDFLKEIISGPPNTSTYVEASISSSSSATDIALLDDRQKHKHCAKLIGQQCNECNIFSSNLTIPQLFRRLREEVQSRS